MAKNQKPKVVITSGLIPKRGRAWAYGYADLAQLFGTTPGAIRQLVHSGRLVPDDLFSIIGLWIQWNPDAAMELVPAHLIADTAKANEWDPPCGIHVWSQPEEGTSYCITCGRTKYGANYGGDAFKSPATDMCPACGNQKPFNDDLCGVCTAVAQDVAKSDDQHTHRWLNYQCDCGDTTPHEFNPMGMESEECLCGTQFDHPVHSTQPDAPHTNYAKVKLPVHMFKECATSLKIYLNLCKQCGLGPSSLVHSWWLHSDFCQECDSTTCTADCQCAACSNET